MCGEWVLKSLRRFAAWDTCNSNTQRRTQIGEILETGRLRKAEATDEMTETLTLFSKIWGNLPIAYTHSMCQPTRRSRSGDMQKVVREGL